MPHNTSTAAGDNFERASPEKMIQVSTAFVCSLTVSTLHP